MNRFEFWNDITVVDLITEGAEKVVLDSKAKQRWCEVDSIGRFSNEILFPKEIVLYSHATGKNKR